MLEGRGEHERAIQAAREGQVRARQLGLARYAAAPLAYNLAESLTSAGRWDEALEVLQEALSLDPAPEARTSLPMLHGRIAVARGEHDTVADHAAAAPAIRRRGIGDAAGAAASLLDDRGPAGPRRPRRSPGRRARGLARGTRTPTRGTCGRCWPPGCGPAPRLAPPGCRQKLATRPTCGGRWSWRRRVSPPGPGRAGPRGGLRRRGLARRGSPDELPGMRRPAWERSASLTRWPTRCCAPRAPPRGRRPGAPPRSRLQRAADLADQLHARPLLQQHQQRGAAGPNRDRPEPPTARLRGSG